ncbi:DUF1330 domain-containing protein [Brevundimonas sp.]|jgi:uncharacterized protein (DUF1330 family)|uniref:DUF1330 domain-containing protein n=1 Tax=Brevundimonas sp. TaxID=1871086 RepID=UPI00184DC177|nr:DUF1330 domain-containing protein [Brevundimonas sp.]MBA4808340.1 DUF1330 domain-containing protein [Brevundimonas sp.]
MTGWIDPSREAMAAFRDLPPDQPIAMINLLRFRDDAAYPADHPDADKGRTGAQAYAAYGKAAAAPFARSGGDQVWLGRPQLTLIGPADEAWDLAFIARYPTAAAFVSMLQDPEYRVAVIHRQAAVADSRLIRCEPVEAGKAFGEAG